MSSYAELVSLDALGEDAIIAREHPESRGKRQKTTGTVCLPDFMSITNIGDKMQSV